MSEPSLPSSGAAALTPADLRPTADGTLTLYSHRYGQTYGSAHGAQAQAQQVFVQGTGSDVAPEARILEIGFGVGQNLRATLAARAGLPTRYHALEFDPVPADVLAQVAPAEAHPVWTALLAAWPPQPRLEVAVGGTGLVIERGDALQAELPRAWATAVYLDGFSPQSNPELWSPPFLARLADALAPGGVLATYSAAGQVRRGLQAAGLEVERRPGPPGKRECLRAVRP